MNQLPKSDNANRLEHNELSGLRIPLGKEVQQIALAFASEQANTIKGKQVFLNTLSVIAVHKCLKWFGFESDFGDCWNKTRRTIFDVADLLVQDWGRIECFPILPGQTFIDLSDVSPDLIETRQGFVGVKFHQYFNFVEMSGFIHLNKLEKSTLEETLTLDIQQLESFENVFNYLPYVSETELNKWNDEAYRFIHKWKQPQEFGYEPAFVTARTTENTVSCKILDFGTQLNNTKILLFVEFSQADQECILKIKPQKYEGLLPSNLRLTICDAHGAFDGMESLDLSNQKSSNFEIDTSSFSKGDYFQVVLNLSDYKIIEKFIF